ncbi:MAG TPA: chromosomal replication initiation protein, partial [Micromonospora sp.]
MADTIDLAAVWLATTDELTDEIVSAQQRAYLRLTRLRAIVEDTALLSVPDAFTRDVIESRLRPAITEALSRRFGRPIQVAVTVRPPEDPARPAGTVYGSAASLEASGLGPVPAYQLGPAESTIRATRDPERFPPPGDQEEQPGDDEAPPTGTAQQPGRPGQSAGVRDNRPRPGLIPASRDGQDALFAAPYPEQRRPSGTEER